MIISNLGWEWLKRRYQPRFTVSHVIILFKYHRCVQHSSDNNPDIPDAELAPASGTGTLGPQPVLRVGLVLSRGKPVNKHIRHEEKAKSSPFGHAVYAPHGPAVAVDAGRLPALDVGLAGPDQGDVGPGRHAPDAVLQLLRDLHPRVLGDCLPEHLAL